MDRKEKKNQIINAHTCTFYELKKNWKIYGVILLHNRITVTNIKST